MKVSIVVPAFNEEKVLGASLDAIKSAAAALKAAGWTWELIVCDNNSNDRTAEIARAHGATVIFEPVNQIARARNRGASIAAGEWIIFVDADSAPSRDLFERVVGEIKDPKCAGGGALVVLDEPRHAGSHVVRLWNTVSRVMRWAAGSFIFCEAALFREIGGFSDKLYASEEVDFSRRLRKAAKKSGRDLVIITGAPLVTSARKLHLYSKGEYLRFILKAVLFPGKVLSSREQCVPWYDGRR